MASATARGTCVPPGPSKNATGDPLSVRSSAGKCERMAATEATAGCVSAASMAPGLSAGLAEDLCREGGDRHVRSAFPPRVLRQSRLQAGLAEESRDVPAPFDRNLRQEEAPPAPRLDEEAVRADLDRRERIGHRDEGRKDRDVGPAARELVRRRGRKARVPDESVDRVHLHVGPERTDGLDAPDAAAELPVPLP